MSRALYSLFAATICLSAAAPALAKEPAPPKTAATVLVQPVAVPVIINGQLASYIYVTLRLKLSDKADPDAMRDKEPFFRDALVRAAFHTPLQRSDDPNVLDETRTRTLVMRESAAIVGPGVVSGVEITRAQPQHYLSKPRPPQPAGH